MSNTNFLKEHAEYILSQQLIRSGTSIGAIVREAEHAESTKDFIHKLAISQKECDETVYWLELLNATHYLSQDLFDSIVGDANELLKIIKSSILTSKSKLPINTSS